MASIDLPPLVALRAFDAAGRHLSATRAADELHVTVGAISHQLRVLEEHLQVALFVRGRSGLTLTPEGSQYHASVSEAFATLRAGTRRLRPERRTDLCVRAHTSFSLRWLIPRLSDFYARYPKLDLTLSVSISSAPIDFERENLDFVIRLGDGHWPGESADRLIPNLLTPVCSPDLVKKGGRLKSIVDLRRHVLLHSNRPEREGDWNDWLRARGIDGLKGFHCRYFETSEVCYQAALLGQGVAMAQIALVDQDLKSGRLVMPFRDALDRGARTYYLVHPGTRRRLTSTQSAFRDWLLEQSALATPAPPA